MSPLTKWILVACIVLLAGTSTWLSWPAPTIADAVRADDSQLLHEILCEQDGTDALAAEKGVSWLHLAAGEGKVGCVKVLLEYGVDANGRDEYGNTALHRALWNYKKDAAAALLAAGADPNVANSNGRTPLHFAANCGVSIALDLLRRGADVNARDKDGRTPLFYATMMSHSAMIELLWRHGADLSVVDADGITVLDLARKGTSTRQLLLDLAARNVRQ